MMASSQLRIIVTGLIAEYPLGGMTWHYLQYVLGLSQLGHDVYYFEDSGGWPYDPFAGGLGHTCDYNVSYLAGTMERYGLGDRWAYRLKKETESEWFGLSQSKRQGIVASADILLNVSGTVDRPMEYRAVPKLVYIDTDPVFAQLKLHRGEPGFARRVDVHDIFFSFGERVSEQMPNTGHHWHPTRQPIIVSQWETDSHSRAVYTTIMNWSSYKSESFRGRTYGQKNVEFLKFLRLPSHLPEVQFELAGGPGHNDPTPREMIAGYGWSLVDPMVVCPDLDSYRAYIQGSRGEWSVAKNAYVEGCSGWFSERSACYLAAGRPVIVQDTGFSSVLPTGEGLHAFTTLEEAIEAVHKVEADHDCHSRAARDIAHEYFDTRKVLPMLIETAFREAATEPSECAT